MITEDKPARTPKKRSWGLIFLVVIFFLCFAGTASVLGYLWYEGYIQLDVADEASNTEESAESEETEVVTEYPAYKVTLGADGMLSVPEGWYISSFYVGNEVSPDSLMSEMSFPASGGFIPVFTSAELKITDGVSTITVYRSKDYVLGPFGVAPGPMEEDYEVIIQPRGDNPGIARKQDGEKYILREIYRCQNEGLCGDYSMFSGSPEVEKVEFEGDEDSLDLATPIFKEAFLEDKFELPTKEN